VVQQYNQNNINSPRGSRLFAADATLDLDSDMVVVTTATGAVTLTLPTAIQIPGQEVTIKANDAGDTGNAVTIAALGGQNIDGAATITLTADQESVCLKSDGSNWRRVCSEAGGASCCSPTWIPEDIWLFGNPVMFIDPGNPLGAWLLAGSLCGQDEPLTVTVRPAFAPLQIPPLITGFVYTPAASPLGPTLRIGYDSTAPATDGDYVVEITNACGCCTIVPARQVSE